MSKSLEIQLLKHQEEFFFSDAIHTGLVAGFGSGKTYSGIVKTVLMKMKYPLFPVAYYLPTYPLIRDIAFPKFKEFLDSCGLRYKLNETNKEFTTDYGLIILRSMDEPENIVGYECAYSLIDECDILPMAKMNLAFTKIVARNRAKLPDGTRNKTDVVGTPEGFKWFWNFFVKYAKENRQLIKAKTEDNPFLPEGYIDTLKDIYTPEQLEAYLNGEFVNLTSGTVYNSFNRELNHSNERENSSDVLFVGMDFNVLNMSAVIHIIKDGNPIAVGEVVGALDTSEMCRILKERYTNKMVIYPDASGKNRSTSGLSDIQIIRSNGFQVMVQEKNPFVRDRVNSMNMAFCDKDGNRKYKVNTDQCPRYTEALEQLGYKNGEPDKSSGFDHLTDAGGYFIYERFGIRRKKIGLSM